MFGASLANGGACPTTGEEVLHHCNDDHHCNDHYHDLNSNHRYHRDLADFGPKSCSRCAQPDALLWYVQLQWTVCFQSNQHDDDKDHDDEDYDIDDYSMFRLVSLKMFNVQVGLPAKSGVSGSLVLVVPGVMGVTINSHHHT